MTHRNRFAGRLLAAVVAVSLAATASVSALGAPAGPRPLVAAADAVAAASRPARLPVGPRRTARGVDSALVALADARAVGGVSAANAEARVGGLDVAGGLVEAGVTARPGSAAEASSAVVAAGGRVVSAYGDLLTVRIPIEAAPALGSAPGVSRVARPQRPILEDFVSEGLPVMDAVPWHTAGRDGTGVKVGIIDSGFGGYAALLGSELPASVATWGGVPGKAETVIGSDPAEEIHGTAVAEIVHDTAPGAQVYLARISDPTDVGLAKDWMVANGVQVINHSAGWLGDKLDGRGLINAIVDDAVTTSAVPGGVVWANAAGNMRKRHWSGNFTPQRGGDPLSLGWNGTSTYVNIVGWSAGDPPLVGWLQWNNDNWDGFASQDYDLLLFYYDPAIRDFRTVAQSTSLQNGTAGCAPIEAIMYTPSASGIYGWGIVKYRARSNNVDFDFFSPYQDLENGYGFATHARSIQTPADNKSAGFISAGAMSATWTIDAGSQRPGLANQEPYSSEGPTQDKRLAPSVLAPDDVSTWTYFHVASPDLHGTFRGTSAASPHLAGAAALVRGAMPASSAAEVARYLESNAFDTGALGPDNQTGYGLLTMPDLATPTPDVRQLAGSDRYRTALAISGASFESSVTTVVVASGAGYADALAGSGLAGCYNSPVLLTPPGGTTPQLLAEIARLGARHAVVLGSTSAVASAVDASLRSAGLTVERLKGDTRYDTAAAIAGRIGKIQGPASSGRAFVMSGANFPDALAASPFAYAGQMPILLVRPTSVPPAIMTAVRSLPVTSVVIGGSTSVVSAGVETALRAARGRGSVETTRKAGATRYDTAHALGAYGVSQGLGSWGYAGIATGANFPDALAGGAATGHAGGVLVLTPGDNLNALAKSDLGANHGLVSHVRLFGGGTALSGALAVQARLLTQP